MSTNVALILILVHVLALGDTPVYKTYHLRILLTLTTKKIKMTILLYCAV